ncbi:ABC transporter ATP-binding protein [Romboutsia sp.]|uniref:ABC transporter ATP-binding protein n=1 Tax=Romboutsia sp. TaxID=1965302 RepID=UPI003F29F662
MKVYIKKYYKLFIIAVIFVSLESICDLLQPSIMSRIVDNGIAQNNMDYIVNEGFKMLLVTFMGAIFALTRNIISINVSQNFSYDLRNDIFKKINYFSSDTIDKYNKASLITRITNDINQLQNFINGTMRVFIKAPILCIGSLIMAIKLNLRLSVVLFFIIAGAFIMIAVNFRIGYPLFKKVQKSLDNLNSMVREYLSGVRVVKIFNKYEYELNKFSNVSEDLYKTTTNAMRFMSIFTPLITLIMNIGIVIVLYLGSINKYGIKIGVIVAYINYMTRILSSLIMISHIFNVFIRAKASYERVSEILKEDNEYNNHTLDTIDKIENIKLENVHFSYNKIKLNPVLKNINLEINKGESIGIIGSTGSGKTTVVNLILKFYKIDGGKITINNKDISQIDDRSIRDSISIVPQNNTLFTGSIIDNIKLGNEKATIEEIIYYSKIAKAHEFINLLDEGYNAKLGQGGMNLSGGQKQRISIARALLKKPQVLILDDATSSLDLSTEWEIKQNLKNKLSALSYIIITQRISSVIDCEKIYVLDEGKIVGEGKHKELIQNCQIYQDIFRSQISGEMI